MASIRFPCKGGLVSITFTTGELGDFDPSMERRYLANPSERGFSMVTFHRTRRRGVIRADVARIYLRELVRTIARTEFRFKTYTWICGLLSAKEERN